MDVPVKPEYPTTTKKLLNELATGKLSLDEFLLECAYWALQESFEEIHPIRLPDKPAKVVEYEGYELKVIRKLERKFYDDFPEVMQYYNKLFWILGKNLAAEDWLTELLRIIPEGDIPARDKIAKRIESFHAYKRATFSSLEAFRLIRHGKPEDQ